MAAQAGKVEFGNNLSYMVTSCQRKEWRKDGMKGGRAKGKKEVRKRGREEKEEGKGGEERGGAKRRGKKRRGEIKRKDKAKMNAWSAMQIKAEITHSSLYFSTGSLYLALSLLFLSS